jgi:hypothetical protein
MKRNNMEQLFDTSGPQPTICPYYRAAAIAGLTARAGSRLHYEELGEDPIKTVLACHGSTCRLWGGRGCGLVDGLYAIADREVVASINPTASASVKGERR